MNNIDVVPLVEQLVALAKTDQTKPKPDNLRADWETDLLFGRMDRLFCYERSDPAGYAEFGRQVLGEVGDFPEVAALARLAIFRGERLLPPSEEQRQTLLEMVSSLKKAIKVLPEGTRKARCSSLFQYHSGVFYDAYGCFAEAADAQLHATRVAKRGGDLAGAAISSFLATLYTLKGALV